MILRLKETVPCAALPVEISGEQLIELLATDGTMRTSFPERVSDQEAELLICRLIGGSSAAALAELPRAQLLAALRDLQTRGLPLNQIARLSGLSQRSLARWLQ